jgi:hypothetical protein
VKPQNRYHEDPSESVKIRTISTLGDAPTVDAEWALRGDDGEETGPARFVVEELQDQDGLVVGML